VNKKEYEKRFGFFHDVVSEAVGECKGPDDLATFYSEYNLHLNWSKLYAHFVETREFPIFNYRNDKFDGETFVFYRNGTPGAPLSVNDWIIE